MKEKFTVALIGCGAFAKNFVPLFKAHPYVEKFYVCDLIPEKAAEYCTEEIKGELARATADFKTLEPSIK